MGHRRDGERVITFVRTTSQLPTDYKPEESMKRMTIADAAAQMFMRAKDAEGLRDALVAKLTEQRNFVLWWDAQAKDPGNKFGPGLNTSVKAGPGAQNPMTDLQRGFPKLEDFGMEAKMRARWMLGRALLKVGRSVPGPQKDKPTKQAYPSGEAKSTFKSYLKSIGLKKASRQAVCGCCSTPRHRSFRRSASRPRAGLFSFASREHNPQMLARAIAVLVILAPLAAHAHGGGLDALGCHHDRKAGVFRWAVAVE